MATISGEKSGTSYSNVTLTVKVELDTCTRSGNTITVRYRALGNNNGSYYSQNSMVFWYNGVKHIAWDNTAGNTSKHTTKNTWYPTSDTGWETQNFSVTLTTDTVNIPIGVNQTVYNPSSAKGTLNFTLSDLPQPTAPKGVSCSVSSITRTSASLSGSYTSPGDYANFSSDTYEWGTSTSYGHTGSSMTGLSANTTYYYRYTVTNDVGYSNSATGSFTTSGNAPSITNIVTSPSRTGCEFSQIYINYDTNDYFGSRNIQYGTSTSYGSSTSNASLSSLNANTKYYYKYNITSAYGRTGYYTGSFTTTGNNPSISSKSVTTTRTGATFNISASYDNNASFSSREIQYGTSTSYGSSTTGDSISSLTANTKYYYKVRVKDNWNRWSSWSTGDFTTTGNAPTVDSVSASPSRTSSSITLNVSYDNNASFSSREIQYGTTTSYGSSITGTSITGLAANTKYYYRARVTDNWSRTSSWKASNFTTTGNNPTISAGSASNIKSKSATISVTDNYDNNASIQSMTIKIYLNNTLEHTLTSSTHSKATGDILKPGKNYVAKVTVTDNWNRTSSEYTINFKTKGGFKFNGKMSDGARLNGKEVIGMKFNGVEII